ELYWDWAPNAEEPVATAMRDASRPELQIRAAQALMKHAKKKYFAEMRDNYLADEKLPLLQRMRWLEMLAWHYPNEKPAESDLDLKFLKLGFSLLDGPASIPRWQGDTSSYITA